VSGSRPGHNLPPGKTRYPLYRRVGGPQGQCAQVRKISPPTGIRSLDPPARRQSLYQLRYSAHKSVHLVGFITKKFVTMQNGHMLRCTVICYDARSHVTMQHGHMLRCTVTCHDAARSHVTMKHGHMLRCSTVTCHDARSHEGKIRKTLNICKIIFISK
jgi:hypothetical protein